MRVTEHRLESPIGVRISSATAALLPTEISGDDAAKWVLEFDSLVRGEASADDARRLISRPSESESLQLELLEQLVAIAAVPRLTFYFGTLFHIGTSWTRAERTAADCRFLLGNDDARRISLSRLSSVVGSDRQSAVEDFLRRACDVTVADSEATIARARRWWNEWRTEVDPQRLAIESLQRADGIGSEGRARLCLEAYRAISAPSLLSESLRDDGVTYTAPPSVDISAAVLSSFIATSAATALMAPYPHYVDPSYVDYYFREGARSMLETPAITAGINVLRERYRDHDPFQAYYPLRKAASEALLDLIAENTLAVGIASPWMSQWRAAIDRTPSKEITLKQPDDIELLREWVRHSTDSTLKYGLIKHHVGAPLSDHLQRVFEDDWIESLAVATAPREDLSEPFVWTFDSFGVLIELAIDSLSALGYNIITPSATRLRKLFSLRTSGGARWNKLRW